MDEWELVFYEEDDGSEPVVDWLRKLAGYEQQAEAEERRGDILLLTALRAGERRANQRATETVRLMSSAMGL